MADLGEEKNGVFGGVEFNNNHENNNEVNNQEQKI